VSPVLSPRTIVTGLQVDFATYCRVPIGAYCEVHDEPTISNTEKSRTTLAIALNPTGNLQGTYHFMSLDTGKPLNRRNWTELPITQKVTDQVHDLADKEEPLEKDATFPDHFQFSWDFENTNKIDAQDDRAILDEIELLHEEANDEASHAPTVDPADIITNFPSKYTKSKERKKRNHWNKCNKVN